MNHINTSLLAAVIFLSLPLFAFSETPAAKTSDVKTKLYSIGLRTTYYTPKDADQTQWYPGAQARLHLRSGLGLEASIDYHRNDYGNTTSIKTFPVQLSLLAYRVPGAPFLLGGGGWYFTQVSGPGGYVNNYSRFGLHLGAGLEIKLSEELSLDGSYRYVWLESVTTKDSNFNDKIYQDSGSMITIALNYLFE
jgi:opacity protein-like surface antigen